MAHLRALMLLAVTGLSVCTAFSRFLPDKEYIYDYKSIVAAGTQLPVEFASSFYLYGKLHIQPQGKSLMVQFSDLKFKMYNGEMTHDFHYGIHEQSLPEEMSDLLKVFKITYNDTFHLMGISTEENEKEYSRNIKKAIASIFQMEQMSNTEVKPYAFVSYEPSIYGMSKNLYNVMPEGDTIVVTKIHDMKDTKHMYTFLTSINDPMMCEAPFEEPVLHSSIRKYVIKHRDGYYPIDYIEAEGGMYFYPFKGKSETQYVHINQTFKYVEKADVKEKMAMKNEHFEDDLTYHMYNPTDSDAMPDIYLGRRHFDMEKISLEAYTMLKEIVEYMEKNHIVAKVPDIKEGQLINRIMRLFFVLDYPTLEQMYTTLVTKTTEKDLKILNVFYEMLPLIGTRASVKMIKTLVHDKKVSTEYGQRMLEEMAANVHWPSEKLLHEVEDMMHWGDEVAWEIRKTALLSFGSLIHKTFQFQKRIHSHRHNSHDHEHYKATNRDWEHAKDIPFWLKESDDYYKIYDKYVTEMVDKLKTAETYEKKMVYLMALHNTKLDSTVKYFINIVKDDWFGNEDMKLHAMFSLMRKLGNDYEKVYEIFWPIFSDETEQADIRIVALKALLSCKPSLTLLDGIFWYITNEEHNSDVHHFYYNFIESWAHTKDPCHQNSKVYAKQTLAFLEKPLHRGYMSNYYLMDYVDAEYGFGSTIEFSMLNTNHSRTFMVRSIKQIFNLPVPQDSYVFKIHGIEERLWSMIEIDTTNPNKLFSFEKLMKYLQSLPKKSDFWMELVGARNGKVIFYRYVKDLDSVWDMTLESLYRKEEPIEISYDMFSMLFMPTDMGMISTLDFLKPVVEYGQKSTKDKIGTSMTFSTHLTDENKVWRHSRYGVSYFNPITDVWHGINKYVAYDSAVPIDMSMSVNTKQSTLKFTMKLGKDVDKGTIGVRSYATNLVFVKDDFEHGVLRKSCEKCENFVMVTKGDQYRHNYVIADQEDYNTGFHKHMEVFDSELHVTNSTMNRYHAHLMMPYTKNYRSPLGHLLLYYANWHARTVLQPTPGVKGLVTMYTPSTKKPVTDIELNLRMNYEVKHEKDYQMPGVKFNTRGTYTLKNEDTVIKTWDLNAAYDINPGFKVDTFKMQMTRVIPGQKDYSVCLDGTKKYTRDGVNGHFNIAMSHASDGKCNKDEVIIDGTLVGERLKGQIIEEPEYGACDLHNHRGFLDYHHTACATAYTSIRKYIYNIKTTNMPQEMKKMIIQWYDYMKSFWMPYYTFAENHDEKIEENNFKIEVTYPVVGYEMDMHMITPLHKYSFTGIPTENMLYMGMLPENTHYSRLFMFMQEMGMMHSCTVYPTHVDHDHIEDVPFVTPTEWTMYVGDHETDAKHGVWGKQIGDTHKMALKIVDDDHTFEIYPIGEHMENYKILMDGKEIVDHKMYHYEDWFSYVVLKDHSHKVVITTHHYNLHMVYDGNHVYFDIPSIDTPHYGHCFSK